MRSGSNWVFLKGKLDRVTTRTLANGQSVSEIHLALPLGRAPFDETGAMMDLTVVTWNSEYAALLASWPAGSNVVVTGHLAERRWTQAGGVERRGTEVRVDHIALDLVDVARQADAARVARPASEPARE
jgi:hypothetical protein